MPVEYLKRATHTEETGQTDVRARVEAMLAEIAQGGEAAVRRYGAQHDKWQGEIVVSDQTRARAAAMVPEKVKADIRFAHDNIRRFAEAQRATIGDCDIEILPGLRAIPAGCRCTSS